MALKRISDLDERLNHGSVVEWQSLGGVRYRYERDRGAVGMEITPGSEQWDWHILAKNDLRAARRRVFELINEDEF